MTSYPTLSGRIAVVTRASTQLGQSICDALADAGAQVFADETPLRAATSTAAEAAQLEALLERVTATTGRLDIMVNTSVLTPALAAEDLPLAEFLHGITLNLNATFFGCQAAAARMLRQTPLDVAVAGLPAADVAVESSLAGGASAASFAGTGLAAGGASASRTPAVRGTIINVSSVAGVVALPGHAAFCAAMAGVHATTKILAAEWGARGVRVVGAGAGLSADHAQALHLRPPLPDGSTPSHRRIPPGTLTTAADVAQLVVYLAGDDARHVHGTTVYVDGGWLADGYWEVPE